MGNTSVGSGKKPPPLTSTGTAPDAPEDAAAIAYAVAQEAAVQGFPSEGGGANAASSPQETRLQKTLQWLPSFNVSSFLFPASSTLPSPTAAAASGAAAAAAFTSAAAASSTAAEAGEALGAVMGLKQEDFACSFFDSPFSTADAQYFPCDGSPQHAVFRSTQGLWLHAYFWFPSGAAAEAASLGGSCSQHPPCAATCVSVEEEPFADATSSAGISPPLQQDEQKGLVQQQPQQQKGKEPQKTEKEEGEEGQQQQTQTEWERACAAASCRGVVILLHGYSGHGRLSYLKKVLPKDYVRQHPSWSSYVAAVPSASSTYSYSSCSTLSPPAQGESAHSKGSSYSSGKGRAGRAAAAMAAALAPCDVDFPEQPACVSRLAAAAGRQGTAAAGEKKLEKEAKAAAAAGAATEAEVVQASGGTAAAAAAEKAKNMEKEEEAAPAAGRGGVVFAGTAAAWERQEVLGPTAPHVDEEKKEATAGNKSVTAAKKREATEKKEAAAAREDTAAAEVGDGRVDRAEEKEQQQKERQASEEENVSSTATPAVLYKGSWAEALTSAGFIVAALDMQGHGLSEGWEGKRAAVRRLDDFAVDVVQFAHIAVQHCRGLRATYYDLQEQQQRRQQQKPQQGGPLTRGEQEEQASKRKDTHNREESSARQRTLPEQEGRLQDARVAALAGARHGAARAPEDNAATARGVAAAAADAAVEAKENEPAIGSGSAIRREEAFAAGGAEGQGAREVVPEDFERKEERTAAREEEPEEGEDPPVFLMGLSLGGAVALRTVQLLCEAAVQQNEAAAGVGGRGNKKKGLASGEDWTFRESSPSSSVAAAPAPATAEDKEEATREKKNAAGRRREEDVVKRGGSRSNRETGRRSIKLAGCVLLSPMLDLEGIEARTEYCQSVLRPTLRLLKKYLPHVVVTKKEAYVKYPFQQQMMNDDPYSYKGGLRASMACEMLDAADQLLGQERLRCMQQPQACCPPLLLVHNFFDTTCGFRGPVKLFEQLPAHPDKTLFLLNASVSRRRCSSSNTGGGSKTSAPNSSGGDDGKSGSDSSKSVASSNSHSTESRSSDESSSRNSNSSSSSGSSSSSSSTSCKGNPSSDLGGKEAGSEYASGLPHDQDGDACVPRREIQQSCVEGGWGCDSKEASEYAAAHALSGGDPEAAGIHKVVLLDEKKKKKDEDADRSSSSRTAAPSVAKGSMKRGPGESSSESEAPADDRGEKAQDGDSGRGADSSTGVSCSPAAKEADGEAHRDTASGQMRDASEAEEEQGGNGSKRSSGNSGGNISGAGAGPGEGADETVVEEEMQCKAFLSTVPPAFNVDVATLKKLQVYADPELHELDVFHGLPLDPENEKVLQRVLLWLLQRAPSRRGIR